MIISSQRHIDYSIVEEKISELEGQSEVTLGTWPVSDGIEILFDGHHTFAAAKELGIKVNFASERQPEDLAGEDLLEQAWMDSDWYDVETGKAAF